MIKRIVALSLFLLFHGTWLMGSEGMWIPSLLQQLNSKEMLSMGLKLSADDIYSINHSSIKDAIIQFGGGCTGVIVSEEGLLLTNHHCGLGTIQRHSTVDHDYLTNGFWARSKEEELPNPGLTVTLLVRIEDVTTKVLSGVSSTMTQQERSQVIKKNGETLEKEAVKGTHYEARVRAFYYGNQYYLFVNEVFRDVRLVGAPPSAIGQFGGDTDNWMWPRHGADFSVFRIYAGKDNNPADYSKENVPYKPRYTVPVSLKGYAKGDFTFVFGYPGTTREYLTSWGVDLIAHKENPARIRLRQERLDIMNEAMIRDSRVRIQYTSKHQGIANGWKKMIGETKGIDRMDAVGRKLAFEKQFEAGSPQSAVLLDEFEKTYSALYLPDMASVYLNEAGLGIEIVRFAGNFRDLEKICNKKETKPGEITKAVESLKRSARGFYKDYYPPVDRKVMKTMLEEMKKNMESSSLPGIFREIEKAYGRDFTAFTENLFSRSFLADSSSCYAFLDHFGRKDVKRLSRDPAFRLALSIYNRADEVAPVITKFSQKIDSLQRIYMAGQMEMQKERRFYPDANSTIRVSYGKVDDYRPADAVSYNYFTTSAGILQKEDPSVYDYAIDPKLKKMFLEKDFGRYADADGSLHVAFTASNHTTGGNSGSPVFDADGNLIGLNFDRNWEGTMSDLMYDPDQCRNITLDIRYCLFIIDKYAGAGNLINELRIRN